jgi:hypothetical protein
MSQNSNIVVKKTFFIREMVRKQITMSEIESINFTIPKLKQRHEFYNFNSN